VQGVFHEYKYEKRIADTHISRFSKREYGR